MTLSLAPTASYLPPRLSALLNQSGEAASVIATLDHYVQWLPETAVMPLFPDFTDHSRLHLRAVLGLIDFLISDGSEQRPNSFEVLTPSDVATLVHATLLHDVGMHLTEEAFVALVDASMSRPRIKELDKQTWPEMWEAFLEEATRWDGRTLARIFGTALEQRESNRPAVRRPPQKIAKWDDLDRRLAGEFVRRHHPRLAHEVALFGWPDKLDRRGFGPTPIPIAESLPKLADLAGLVARSHGSSIRCVLPYLEANHFNLLESREVHAVYLMALLRTADFLHLHAERAPGGIAQIQKLASPISCREHAAHQAIYDVRLDTDADPEAVVVDVDPDKLDDVATYLRLQGWLLGLQSELDHSWAILGEVYGRHPRLAKLWLMLRRVKSNLGDRELATKVPFIPMRAALLATKVPFIPMRAAFEAAGGDFLKLLIRPLYGDRPEVGVRELMQNALDSVRERRVVAASTSGDGTTVALQPLDQRFPDSDVIVSICRRESGMPSLEDGGPPSHWVYWVEVCDRGIGMTPEMIRDYFLKAGATYRRSNAWLREFADDQGQSRVLRSGRFGVGALATFLIGEELQVVTRHHTATSAVTFCASIDGELVQLRKAERTTGTTVRVRADESVLKDEFKFKYECSWYRLADPKLTRCFCGKDVDAVGEEAELMPRASTIPSEQAVLPPAWRRIVDNRFSDVQWTYLDDDAPQLACNGIRVEVDRRERPIRWHTLESSGTQWGDGHDAETALRLRVPRISVFDPNGQLPLNLARDGLTVETLPFSERLLESVIRDLIAYALVCGPTAPLRGHSHAKHRKLAYPGYKNGKGRIQCTPWISLRSGFTLPQLDLLRWAKITRCVVLVSRHKARKLPSPKLDDFTAAIGFANALDNSEFPDFEWPLGAWWPRVWVPRDDNNPLADERAWAGCRVVVNRDFAKYMERRYGRVKDGSRFEENENQPPFEMPVTGEARMQELANSRFVLLESSDSLPPIAESQLPSLTEDLVARRRVKDAGIVAEWYLKADVTAHPENAVVALWRQIVRRPVIPYDLEGRRQVLRHAFEELRDEVAAWNTVLEAERLVKASEQKPTGSYPCFTHRQSDQEVPAG